ncbi:SRPBCC domain-containing protein [Nakamurella aerolata]|uniref:SRPBCC family protein n=1 Tax=Nakamurella aerolata TaxID=1656892 RepID=A0A849A5D4_9ACTN|nr:SRPBCC family protein [Nakamurella aerolata]
MELDHRFELPVGIDRAWPMLLDIATVGPCFPGAELEKVSGDEFSGSVKLKAGPVRLSYRGQAKIIERNDRTHTATIQATGQDSPATTAAMLVTATAAEVAPGRTLVDLRTTLALTGRPADFTRPLMISVGNDLVSRFADCVSTKLVGRASGGAQLIDVENPDEVAADREEALAHPGGGTGPNRGTGYRPIAEFSVDGRPASGLLRKVLPAVLAVVGALVGWALLRRRPDEPDSGRGSASD